MPRVNHTLTALRGGFLSLATAIGAIVALLSALMLPAAAQAGQFSTDDEKNTIEVFNFASPAVVYVTNETLVRDRWTLQVQRVPRGAGTGFVWDDQGHIVTNFHVVEGARRLTITLQDQSEWPALVVGLAPDKDLAVLKIEAPAEKLKSLPLGNSADLTVGRKVLAIGNPFGLDTTLTVGVVSALGREIEAPNQRRIRNVIQTDAAINPGNSGGPLLDSSGNLIGVNTAIYSPSGASVGIGFAIPVNTVREIVPELIEYGRLVRPILGIESAPDQWARRYGVQGVPIMRVAPGLPADRAGLKGAARGRYGSLQLGDIITAIDDQQVRNYDDLLTALEQREVGDQVSIEYLRDGTRQRTSLKLAPPQ